MRLPEVAVVLLVLERIFIVHRLSCNKGSSVRQARRPQRSARELGPRAGAPPLRFIQNNKYTDYFYPTTLYFGYNMLTKKTSVWVKKPFL